MTIAEYNKITAITEQKQEENMIKESKEFAQNVDEIAAKYQREKMKKYRARVLGEDESRKTDVNKSNGNQLEAIGDNYKRDPEVLATEAQPYGQWQTIIKK